MKLSIIESTRVTLDNESHLNTRKMFVKIRSLSVKCMCIRNRNYCMMSNNKVKCSEGVVQSVDSRRGRNTEGICYKMRANLQNGMRIRDSDSKRVQGTGRETGACRAEEVPFGHHRTPYSIRQLSMDGELAPVMKA